MTLPPKPLAPPPSIERKPEAAMPAVTPLKAPAQAPKPLPPRPAPAVVTKPKAASPADALKSLGPTMGKRADLFYGVSGATKTTQLGWIARYIHKTTGKRCRLMSADPGGYEPIQSLVDEGLIVPFVLSPQRTNVYETLNKLCLGWWPVDPNDLESPLEPPTKNGIAAYGGFFFESLASIGDILMNINVTDLANIQVPRSESEKLNFLRSGEYSQRFSSQTDYGQIQGTVGSWVRNSGMLPGLTVWTSVESLGEEKDKQGNVKRRTPGPDIIGQKATANCGPWFGNFIHIDTMDVKVSRPDPLDPKKTIEIIEPRPFLFLKSHIRPSEPTLKWGAKTRAPMELHQEVPPYMEPRADKFYEFMDSLKKKQRELRPSVSKPNGGQ